MTREEELSQLVAEQEADDTYFCRPQFGAEDVSKLTNVLSVDRDGCVVDHRPAEKGTVLVQPATGQEQWHGTFGGYTNHRCRCPRCTAANREHTAERKLAARRGKS